MFGADFGVSLAFGLTIASSVLCIWYGSVNWNKDSQVKVDKSAKKWAKVEDNIEKGL
ncbi:MAG: symporter small accessory protein [Halarcobacter sp.]